jgi:hypothetical protein
MEIKIHEDIHVGVTMGRMTLRRVPNHGVPCWIATAPIGSIFGAEVEGELTGIGRTKEQAIECLEAETKRLAESLWD